MTKRLRQLQWRNVKVLVTIVSLLTLFGVPCRAQNVALTLIDMQHDFMVRQGAQDQVYNQENIRSVIDRQKQLIQAAKRHHAPIIVVSSFESGAYNEELLREIGDYDKLVTFEKYRTNIFESDSGVAHAFPRYLDEHNISKIIVAGANGGACVQSAIASSLAMGYKVVADNEGI